jgi:hypothetical protein
MRVAMPPMLAPKAMPSSSAQCEVAALGFGDPLVFQQHQHRDADGQHERRGGGVAHPHAQAGGGNHEAAHHLVQSLPGRTEDHSAMRRCRFQRCRPRAMTNPAQEQKDQRVGIGRRGLADLHGPEQGQQAYRQQGGHRDRHGLGDPPDGHEERQGGHLPGRQRHLAGRAGPEHEQEYGRPQ